MFVNNAQTAGNAGPTHLCGLLHKTCSRIRDPYKNIKISDLCDCDRGAERNFLAGLNGIAVNQ